METKIEFINQTNQEHYLKQVMDWLEKDYFAKDRPNNHFWHNKNSIEQAFEDKNALIALSATHEVVGYMIWQFYDIRAEINIVEVKENYRKQGILKKILTEFVYHYNDIAVLTASVLPQSEAVFAKLGWLSNLNNQKKHYFICKPCVPSQKTLPDGPVIAICPHDYYQVKKQPETHQHFMEYFPIQLDKVGKLNLPIITPFHYEGYIGIYLNRELILDGKAKYLFKNTVVSRDCNLLVLSKFIPSQPDIFYEKGFLVKPQQQEAQVEQEDNMDNKHSLTSIFDEKHILADRVKDEFKIGTHDHILQKRKRSVIESDNPTILEKEQPLTKKLKAQSTSNQNQFFKSVSPEKSEERESYEKDTLVNKTSEFKF